MPNDNLTRCPKCFSLFGTWTDDPILTKNGAKYIFDEISGLLLPELLTQRRYKGFTRIKSEAIKELQDIRHQQEIDSGISIIEQTSFSKVQSDEYGYWLINKNIIKELRESTEKILTTTGQTKEEYFNYDENGVERQYPHQTDWIDLGLGEENWTAHIKDAHIEDLRKFISCLWAERFYITPTEIYYSGTDIVKEYTLSNIDTASRGGYMILSLNATSPIIVGFPNIIESFQYNGIQLSGSTDNNITNELTLKMIFNCPPIVINNSNLKFKMIFYDEFFYGGGTILSNLHYCKLYFKFEEDIKTLTYDLWDFIITPYLISNMYTDFVTQYGIIPTSYRLYQIETCESLSCNSHIRGRLFIGHMEVTKE